MIPKTKFFVVFLSLAILVFVGLFFFIRHMGVEKLQPILQDASKEKSFFSLAFLNTFISANNNKLFNNLLQKVPTYEIPRVKKIPSYSIPDKKGGVNIEGRWDTIQNNQVRAMAQSYSLSPHTHSVRFNLSSTGLKRSEVQKEFVVIEAKDVIEAIDISEWKIVVGSKNKGYEVPEGVLYFSPGKRNYESRVQLKSGWRAIIVTGKSPRGKSFHINVCSGYAEQFKNFSPTIKLNCPLPAKEVRTFGADIPFNDVKCYSFIDTFQRCSAVVNIPQNINSKQCKTFLREVLTEEGCIERHGNDDDFLIGEWRLFLRQEKEIYPNTSDVLFLLDKENRLVDVFHY